MFTCASLCRFKRLDLFWCRDGALLLSFCGDISTYVLLEESILTGFRGAHNGEMDPSLKMFKNSSEGYLLIMQFVVYNRV